jgi:filamentous hemagglutinin
MGFRTAILRADHFQKHGADFSAATDQEYEQLADTFCGGPTAPSVLQGTRRNGDRVLYDPLTEEFGVVDSQGCIRTYFKADPQVHGHPSNLDYFIVECAK